METNLIHIPVCLELVKSEFSEVLMEINKVELDPKVETFIESEQENTKRAMGSHATTHRFVLWQNTVMR